jgi:hypothetical protein
MGLNLFGLPTLFAPYTVAAFFFMGMLITAALGNSFIHGSYRNYLDRCLFWIFGFILCAFAFFRPFGLALDDQSYLNILSDLCPAGDCSNGSPVIRDFIWFWLVRIGLQYSPESIDSALALSSLGVFVKLFVIDRLCRQRLLALSLLIPLSFIQYDMTQLRAGFASSWMMLSIYWLARSKIFLGSLVLLSNFLVHSQGIFSVGLLIYRFLNFSRWLFPILLFLLLGFTFTGIRPDETMLSWLGLLQETETYFSGAQADTRDGAKVFALGYLPIILYGVWLWSAAAEENKKIADIVSTSLLLGTFLAWFFALIPLMQTRLFDFYALPLVLLVGNIGNSKLKITLTCLLALLLYLRLELFQDWILG